jgi:hypothetical protein
MWVSKVFLPCFGRFFEYFALHLLKHIVDMLEIRNGQLLNRAYKKKSVKQLDLKKMVIDYQGN